MTHVSRHDEGCRPSCDTKQPFDVWLGENVMGEIENIDRIDIECRSGQIDTNLRLRPVRCVKVLSLVANNVGSPNDGFELHCLK